MVERRRRYCSCSSHGLSLPLLLLSFFSFLRLHASFAAAAAAPPLRLNSTQESILRDLSRGERIAGWNTTASNPCLWSGIACSPSDSTSFSAVTGIALSGYGISNSSVLASICALDTLLSLDLSRNSLAGLGDRFLGPSCSMKEGLRSLNLSSNQLAASLADLSGFPRLEVLDLSFNHVRGNLSTELGRFPQLRSLNLSTNGLNGGVPTSMVLSLEELVLSGNHLRGPIPPGLFAYADLVMLDLSQNNLTGDVPDEFWKLDKLETLLLSGNELSGAIPGRLPNSTTMSRFAANQNKFTGSIPSGITEHVKMLDLSYNKLSGKIPSDLLASPVLETIDLTSNSLEGPIPGNFSAKLFRLRLGMNLLTGSIPDSIGDASKLAYLELDHNRLTGSIPPRLGECSELALLNLASNGLHGQVPDQISTLEKLVVLKLQMNNLSGSIRSTFSSLTSLSILNLSRNSFTGDIPQSVDQLSKLSNMNLAGNKISGPIPPSVGSLQFLIELNLGDNSLTGTIPKMPVSLSTSLNLSHNSLSGSIPSNIGTLKELEILDLSYNSLSGTVPTPPDLPPSLTLLVLSYNQLTGYFQAPPHVVVSTTGNPGLTTASDRDGDGIPSDGKKKNHAVLITIFAIVGALVGLCLLATVIMFSLSKRIYRVEDIGPPPEQVLPQIINGHLITMNSIHTTAIDLSYAMEAVSSPNNIFLKTRFCTYYKAAMPNRSIYSVKKLDWSDKIFQIGSQEKFGHELEVLGKLSNSNVMVPLAYVLTENNAYLLYEHAYKGTVFDLLHDGRSDGLDWPSRYSIALGVAQGLTFLHGRTQPVLLLDLSTRTIHLKSMNEPQIGDIELYKIIDPSKSSGSLSTIAGTVGYIPPEYAYTMRLTMAGNVYSFGVILLELLTGRPSVSDGTELAQWALSLSVRPEQREQVLDTRVSRTSVGAHSQMLSVLNIALSCVSFSPDARPKMRNVLRLLVNAK
ncbi:leucine-rich repeat receptor-like tyrosine-protein kinase PXC3 [Lolium rigidum]|uniref:leucine-rich repeat receptor-like tyrosine-protein kinase PXC3 n=1 Tax=Lolium rigidum TaxID=89674 RepID=UPI001F5C96FB|nr:leucine-rich repeat receptor-like tyrosine-protein kinase PXC3 [Lolium rigidum]